MLLFFKLSKEINKLFKLNQAKVTLFFALFLVLYAPMHHVVAQNAGLPPPPAGFAQGQVMGNGGAPRSQNNTNPNYNANYNPHYPNGGYPTSAYPNSGYATGAANAMPRNAPPRSGLGQTVNVIATPKSVPPVPIHKKVERIFNEFERAQLTPKQMKHVKKMNLTQQEVLSSPYNNTPKPVTRTLILNLSPGVSAPVLRLSAGTLTSVVFSSNNGDPWYIDYVKLNRNYFSDGMIGAAAGAGSPPTNVLTLEPLRSVAQGNISIMLKGLSTPVIFSLSTGQADVDFRVDAKVPGRNPDSTIQVSYEERMPNLDDNVPYFLDGVPPKGAKRLKVTGGDVEAWRLNNNMYIRTNAEVQYPAYHSSARSTSGLAVYRFDQAYHAVTLLQGGRAYTVQIEGQD